MSSRFLMLATLVLSALLAPAARAGSLTVFAAASLADALTEIARVFDARGGHRTILQFAGSQILRAQVQNGARADVLASADLAQYQPLVRAGLVEPGRILARNRLVVIAAAASSARTLADLARPGLRLAIALPAVPAGRQARAALESLERSGALGPDYAARVLRNVVTEENDVRRVALKVRLGEADAGLVYATDLTPATLASVRKIEIPARHNPPVSYPIGLLKSARPEAREFVAFALSPAGQAILRRWGFLAPAGSR